VRNEPDGGVESIVLAVRRVETAIERGLGTGPLLLQKAGRESIRPSASKGSWPF
jgi:hypothetical protein